ncbi:hypothetical protein GQ473_01985 [archaeon]|nr:hypothetical protein [archaeon]
MFKKIYFVALISLILLLSINNTNAVQETHNVTISLNIIGSTPIIGADYILTNNTPNMVAGIVVKDNANNIQTTSTIISVNYNLDTKAFIIHTKGTTTDSEDRISIFKSDNYNNLYNPSFAFPIDKKNKVEIGLEYDSIDIENNEIIRQGFQNLRITNNGILGVKNILIITKE